LRGRGFARTPLGEITKLQELPDPLAGFQRAASRQGGEREEKKEEEKGRG